jgi:hypothetical protein
MKDHNIFSWALDTNGDGAGTKAANKDFTSTDWVDNGTFFLMPTLLEEMAVTKLLVEVSDGAVFDAAKYGDLTALTTGITIRINSRSGVLSNLTNGLPIKKNADWARLASNIYMSTSASGDNVLHAVIEFNEPIVLLGRRRDKLEVVIPNEDLSGLSEHYFVAQGYYLRGGGAGRVTRTTTTSNSTSASTTASSSASSSASTSASSTASTTASTSGSTSASSTASTSGSTSQTTP